LVHNFVASEKYFKLMLEVSIVIIRTIIDSMGLNLMLLVVAVGGFRPVAGPGFTIVLGGAGWGIVYLMREWCLGLKERQIILHGKLQRGGKLC
jgi:hypothetical protein